MSTLTVLLVALSAISNIAASLLLKRAALGYGGHLKEYLFSSSAHHAAGAVCCYVLAFVFYAALLRYVPVNRAYAFITMTAQLGLILGGVFLFGEKISATAWVGFAAIFSGVALLAWSTE